MRMLFATVSGRERGIVVVQPASAIEEGRGDGDLTRYEYAFRPSEVTGEPGEVRGPYDTPDDAIEGARQRFGTALGDFHAVPLGVDPWEYAGSKVRG